MDACEHEWIKVHEQLIIGGSFPIGWQCSGCNKFVSISAITPAGLAGHTTGKHKLVGIHGGNGNCADGSIYKEQILHEDGRLEIIWP